MAFSIRRQAPVHELGEQISKALGLDHTQVVRLILDIDCSKYFTKVYVEMYGDDKLLAVDWAMNLQGAEIRTADGAR